MATTIQLNENVKSALDKLKSNKETYEEIIVKMMKQIEEQKRRHIDLMIEGYEEMAEESLKICEEWKYADAEMSCEWKEYGN